MTLMRRVLIPVLAVAAIFGVVAWRSSASPATAATTYNLTIAGTDMHTLDPHYEPMFVPGGGVKAVEDDLGTTPVTYRIFEAGLDLPVGAKVTSIAISRTYCSQIHEKDTYIFGSYSPATRNTVQTMTIAAPATCTPKTLTKTGNPITTTVAGRRYALDYEPNVTSQYPGSTTPDEVFYGATIKYTCTSPCVP